MADWVRRYFSFVDRVDLAERLADEYRGTRYTYKLLEGMEATGWLLRTQVRIQVLSYASLYEAVIHHILFERMATNQVVQQLREYSKLTRIDVPQDKRDQLQAELLHNGKTLVTTFQDIGRTEEGKVRFDAKAQAACELGFLEKQLVARVD